MPHPALDKLGRFIIKNLRDKGIDSVERLLDGQWKAPDLLDLQKAVSSLPDREKRLIRACVRESIDTAMHDFLFALGEAFDFEEGITLIVDGKNVAEISDGLQAEPLTKDGWIAKYSKFD